MRCKNCKEKFEPTVFLQKHCKGSIDCLTAEGLYKLDQQKKANEKKRKEFQKKERADMKVLKESILSHSDWLNLLQPILNHIARLIDLSNPCMMCANPNMKRINGCHFHSVSSRPALRFNLLNIWAGCHKCNVELSGNINGYDYELVKAYGKPFWESLKFDLVANNPTAKLTIEEVKEKIIIGRAIIKELKAENKTNSLERRVELRRIYNTQLGIYT